jgi:uncharacterized membrane protein HdeD (DUF308 family)
MKMHSVRAFLAVIVVGVFMLITGFMALFPLLSHSSVDLNQYADFFAKTASVYTGIIGVIIGYYFGKSDETGQHTPSKGSATPEPTITNDLSGATPSA